MSEFRVGQVVKLNSGGPGMTVKEANTTTDEYICQWFSGTRLIERAFKGITLKDAGKIDTLNVVYVGKQQSKSKKDQNPK